MFSAEAAAGRDAAGVRGGARVPLDRARRHVRGWWWTYAAAALLLASVTVQLASLRDESQTFDESVHLTAGYLYWRTGDLSWNREHPPLVKYVCALPLLWMNPRLPVEHESWAKRDMYQFARQFMYHNRVPADSMLLAGRSVTVGMTALLGILVLLYGRCVGGDLAGVGAMALILFEPNIVAHGRYITTDLPVTLFGFAACAAWFRFLAVRRWRWCVASGVALGLALASKFSALLLLPVFPIAAVLAVVFATSPWRRVLAAHAAVAILAWTVVSVVYAAEGPRLVPGIRLVRPDLPSVENVPGNTQTARAVRYLGHRFGVAESTWLWGIADVAEHDRYGHETYLSGQIGKSGWWYYFPVVFAVKTSAGLLIALAAAALGLFAVRKRRALPLILTLLPAPIFFGVSMSSHINIGVRHILPVYPFLAVACAAVLARSWWKWILVGCMVIVAVECWTVHPYYLSFFNVFAGGPSQGTRYLLDSNIDWGQDAIRLRRYVRSKGADHACICYFGQADLRYYGINEWTIPDDPSERAKLDCLTVVSVTPLYGLYVPPDRFAWFRARTPDDRIGYSMNVYDLRRHR